jgi:hypothetical protein
LEDESPFSPDLVFAPTSIADSVVMEETMMTSVSVVPVMKNPQVCA